MTALGPKADDSGMMGARTYFDCTWPPDWDPEDIPGRCAFDDVCPEDVQKKALETWAKYGY
jgi:hypothetical protein